MRRTWNDRVIRSEMMPPAFKLTPGVFGFANVGGDTELLAQTSMASTPLCMAQLYVKALPGVNIILICIFR